MIATLSLSLSCLSNNCIPSITNGNLLAAFMEPLVSSKKTRLHCGRSSLSIVLPFNAILARRCSSFHGQDVTLTRAANGWSSESAGG